MPWPRAWTPVGTQVFLTQTVDVHNPRAVGCSNSLLSGVSIPRLVGTSRGRVSTVMVKYFYHLTYSHTLAGGSLLSWTMLALCTLTHPLAPTVKSLLIQPLRCTAHIRIHILRCPLSLVLRCSRIGESFPILLLGCTVTLVVERTLVVAVERAVILAIKRPLILTVGRPPTLAIESPMTLPDESVLVHVHILLHGR